MAWLDPDLSRRLPAPVQAAVKFAHTEAVALAGVVVIAGATLAFIDIADDSSEPDGRAFDLDVLRWLHPGPDLAEPIGPAWFDHAMHDLTSLGSVAVLGVVALIIIGYLLFQKQRLKAAELLASLGGGLALSETLKQVFERSRPPPEYHAMDSLNASFPSGHALLSTVFYLTVGAMLARSLKKKRLKAYVLGVAVALALTVGASRVYLGVHWASDVLAGWCVGAAWAMTCWLAERSIARAITPAAEARQPDDPDNAQENLRSAHQGK